MKMASPNRRNKTGRTYGREYFVKRTDDTRGARIRDQEQARNYKKSGGEVIIDKYKSARRSPQFYDSRSRRRHSPDYHSRRSRSPRSSSRDGLRGRSAARYGSDDHLRSRDAKYRLSYNSRFFPRSPSRNRFSSPARKRSRSPGPRSSSTSPRIASHTGSAASLNESVPDATLKTYQHLLRNNPDDIAFLFGPYFSDSLEAPSKRIALVYHLTKEDVMEEFRRLLAIKVSHVDEDANKISPTPLMDELWHAAILDTRFYADLQKALGLTLHHRPSVESEQNSEQREERLKVMTTIYCAKFLTDPLEARTRPASRTPPQDRITIFIMLTTGKTVAITTAKNATIDSVMSSFQDKEGVPKEDQRLIFAGRQLEDSKTLEYYKIGSSSTIHFVRRLRGC